MEKTPDFPVEVPSRRRGGLRRALLVALIVVMSLTLGAGGVFAVTRIETTTRVAAKGAPTPSPTLPPALLTPPTYIAPPCHILPEAPQMLTPQELANPIMEGYEIHGYNTRGCIVKGLYVPAPAAGVPQVGGKVILVSLKQQWLWAYADGKLQFANPVTTGQDWLPTPQGRYKISEKIQDTEFYSPWPPSSRFYYSPEHVNYAMYFRDLGYFIHDAPWRHAFGPGTNVPHVSPDGTHEDGSHGCVNMTTPAAKWLYGWASIGTTVIITN